MYCSMSSFARTSFYITCILWQVFITLQENDRPGVTSVNWRGADNYTRQSDAVSEIFFLHFAISQLAPRKEHQKGGAREQTPFPTFLIVILGVIFNTHFSWIKTIFLLVEFNYV